MDLIAPSHWRTLEFHSDVHLYEKDLPTFKAWQSYLSQTEADAVFILGDLFEVWIGDDILDADYAFEESCLTALRACSGKRPLFFLPGNRDFLVGDRLLQRAGMQRLEDPTTLVFQDTRFALSHGDALCTDDLPYQQFRTQVRSWQWQHSFLAKSLAERDAMARAIREASETRKQESGTYTDVNGTAVDQLMQAQKADVLIHGHTHLAATHFLENGRQRMVLSDWSAQDSPPRLEVLRVQATPQGLRYMRVPVES